MSFRLWLIAGAAAAVAGALTWSHTAAFRHGRAAEQAAFLERINQENDNAGNAAEDWRAEYRRCVGAGGVYDFETGACDR